MNPFYLLPDDVERVPILEVIQRFYYIFPFEIRKIRKRIGSHTQPDTAFSTHVCSKIVCILDVHNFLNKHVLWHCTPPITSSFSDERYVKQPMSCIILILMIFMRTHKTHNISFYYGCK